MCTVAPPCPQVLSPSPLSISDIWGLALGVMADHVGFVYCLCSMIPGWYPPWDALLLPVSEGPYTGPLRALAKYSSSNTVRPMQTQQHGLWISAVPLFSNHRVTQPQGRVSASPAQKLGLGSPQKSRKILCRAGSLLQAPSTDFCVAGMSDPAFNFLTHP